MAPTFSDPPIVDSTSILDPNSGGATRGALGGSFWSRSTEFGWNSNSIWFACESGTEFRLACAGAAAIDGGGGGGGGGGAGLAAIGGGGGGGGGGGAGLVRGAARFTGRVVTCLGGVTGKVVDCRPEDDSRLCDWLELTKSFE